MFEEWIWSGLDSAPWVVVSGVVVYATILLYTRVVGLRSFSKMSASDFAMTVAVGSLFAATVSSPSPSLAIGLLALAVLYAGQWGLAVLRRRIDRVRDLVDNRPLLLMHEGRMLERNMCRANVSRSDVLAKLRESNTLELEHVLAVVFETTGDISVLHSSDPEARLEPELLADVRGVPHG
jgi:uncharacterized membrane protein YcaP (DUF421 family)